MPILDRGIWVSSSLWLSMRQSQWLEPKHCAGCRARTVSLRCSRIGFPMGMLGPLPGTAGCWGQLPSALNETLLPAAPSKGTSLPGRVLAESLAGVPVPLRSVNACNGASMPVMGHQCLSEHRCQQECQSPQEVSHFSRGRCLWGTPIPPCECHQPLCEPSVPGRGASPRGVGPSRGPRLAEDGREGSMQIAARVQSIDVTSSRQPGT